MPLDDNTIMIYRASHKSLKVFKPERDIHKEYLDFLLIPKISSFKNFEVF